ncbi:MAG TPA: DNA-directed RNA polymerase subunit beta [Candidatus Hydrogenedentes bacterium]|nr:DNA-directed RNA polymerase subunit beta [Candidatus Hydrogenedentota bacterium]HPG65621.1 DNA-directed RNA polymerase subunit beta [Candidatus Hydrogenedentota bacterium]
MAVAPKRFTDRPSLGMIPDPTDLPDLIEIQTKSYSDFLQWDVPPDQRERVGLQEVFLDVFPIASPDNLTRLEFVYYSFTPPKYSVQECQERGVTYAASLKALLRLVQYEEVGPSNELRERGMLEQEVFLGELPIMTPTGTFIINGAERVIVSQLHKSPGVSFERKTHPNGKPLLSARIIPYRGAWLEFEYDVNDILWLTIDRRSRVLATTFLRAFGYEEAEDILGLFHTFNTAVLGRTKIKVDGKPYDPEEVEGRYLARDVIDPETGEVLADAGTALTLPTLERIMASPIKEVFLVSAEEVKEDSSILDTLAQDKTETVDDALREIYARIRPGDPATDATTRNFFQRMFFDASRYDFAPVGRYKINRKLGLDISQETKTLTREDIVATLRYLVNLRNNEGVLDDIDHLGNRRVRAVGELLANQVRIGLVRMERTVRERMNFQDDTQLTPQTLVNPKPVSAVIKDFFGRSQLSHFMDQINPLAELTHKRRLSALGPGGLSRERAGFEVRDVHPTHYGRICPIETPEGPNIGLMASLSTYARINRYGFLETPYLKVTNGRVGEDVEFLSAYDEDNYIIAQANAPLDKRRRFVRDRVLSRHRGDFPQVPPTQVDYMDISPKQLVSVAAALIPFLEHDDANRALMGSNMQRQAVPLLATQAPLVGTGLEHVTAKNAGSVVRADRSGIVEYADSEIIRVRHTKRPMKDDNPFRADEDEYRLKKYMRSNQNTCINQRPIVHKGDKVESGEIIADGPATASGELALGRNVLCAFLPWEGYNFEDAILISEDLVKEDAFTSVHVQVFEIEARDTKLGPEEVTRDIPNVSEDALRNLDESGIVRIGAKVRPGDILVGKVTPKGETELAPEEKLLRAIFGEKAEDVRDASLTVSPGVEGVVVDVKVCSRRDKASDQASKSALNTEVARIKRQYQDRINEIRDTFVALVRDDIIGLKILDDVVDHKTDELVLEKGKRVKVAHLEKADYSVLARLHIEQPKVQQRLTRLVNMAAMEEAKLVAFRDSKIETLRKGDELPPGVIKLVKVFVATKRRMSVGDKMAGRHGNKGVIAKILPVEDMPFLPDGTPIQIVLNPLGVPSRMNVGQILETHLGWAAHALGMTVATPVFNGASEEVIREYLQKAGLPPSGKISLRDGRTGRAFDQEVTVGFIYMMKLNHLVDDKIHARAIGPYSLVTQQPLGGKAQFGGQRFGEMEVWALQAYGAAYTLQELLTIKSDDIQGRTKAYEAIVKGERDVEAGTPESFNVLVREMQSLCLDVIKLVRTEGAAEAEEEEEPLEEIDLG